MLRKGVCAVTNLDLTELRWLQVSLPVTEGGLGVIRRVTSLAPSAVLESAVGTETLQQLLLRSATVGSADPTVTSVRSTWLSVHGLPFPPKLDTQKE